MEAKILVRVVFIGVKCYNERAWEAKLASQALYAKSLKISLRIQAEETGGNLS